MNKNVDNEITKNIIHDFAQFTRLSLCLFGEVNITPEMMKKYLSVRCGQDKGETSEDKLYYIIKEGFIDQ